ncbi:MAG: hypothetical protein A2W91_16230 [Bacteroidetes bacterium GWF2_38_335]|nr:MAG: hypothetical protein A2W91_16230 [Bacteroidetes bacterium GWF2_38_335]OFY81237.1 MAG: hypothetical protein A2281_07205 [Bacteroidetes bacterium RIFOXYA12_FULL_38_20]
MEKEVTKKISATFEEEIRFSDNVSRLKKFYSELGVGYKLSKKFDLSVSYRYITQYKTDYSVSPRFYYIMALSWGDKFGRFKIKVRGKYMIKGSRLVTEETMINPMLYYRNLVEVMYNIPKAPLNPFLSYELFVPLNNPYGVFIDGHRTTLGVDLKINKKNTATVYFRNDREANVENPLNAFIFGFGYKLDIN